jgi:phosphoribosyl-ATP pyrophosphohydrolase
MLPRDSSRQQSGADLRLRAAFPAREEEDLLHHMLVALRAARESLDDVRRVLDGRRRNR